MADDSERLAILVEGRVADFEKALKSVERKVDKMGKGVNDNMKGVERASKRAADVMEREFAQATTGVSRKLAALRNGFGDARNLLGGLGPAAGLAGLAGGVGAGAAISQINRTTAAIAAMADAAKRAGISFEAFQELGYAFSRERVSIDALTDGIKELQLRADEFAVTGKGSAAEAFTRLGYGADELAAKLKDPQELFLDIIKRLEGFDRAAQIRIADEIFGGTGGEQFVQLLDAGEGKLRANIQRARDLGIVLSSDVADRAAEVNNAFTEMSAIIESRVNAALTNTSSWVLKIGRNIATWEAAAEKFLSALGNTDSNRSLNQWLIAMGIADTSGVTLLDPDLKATAVAKQTERVEQLQSQWQAANDEVQRLEDADAGATAIDAARRQAALLTDELSRANAQLQKLSTTAPTSVTVHPSPTGSTTASGLPQPIEGTMGAHGQRLVRISTASGQSAMVNAEHARSFQGLIDDLERQGYQIRSLGGYNNRNIAGTNTLSNHAFGNAIDINPAQNPMGDRLVTDLPVNVAELARKHGLEWGGSWQSRKDAMHFEAPGSGTERELQRAAQSAETDRAKVADDAMRQAEALARVNEELARELEIENKRAELQAAGFDQDAINNALDEEALVREKLNQLKAAGIEVDAQQEEKIRALVSQLFELRDATDQAAAAQQKLEQAQQDVGAAAQAIGQPILDTLLSLGDGAEDAGEKFKQLAKQIANMVLQGALFGQGPLGNLFGGGLLGGLLGRASGGPVRAGQPYMVGEQGKELFVPGANGTILDANRTKSMMDRMMTPSMAGASASAPGSGIEKLVIEIASRFDADGGFDSAVERTAGPIARAESRKASDRVARSVPSISDARSHDKETRKTRTLRGWGVPD
ncbi:hypothetical protein DLJ53_20730 [Acuticoccus sediminis]|uniref:Peptidase M15C domain-containing protein n=1 Tax=Acuticoccus sediminis TaxID=2184697 RepID=A0A8B2NQ58_9HYPH|nr:M15 family metallopeptidase [Acuticoccus sediminis]RAI00138.1 hypothetical protein DLJ53_20730 [Acuticoccus sediminis]